MTLRRHARAARSVPGALCWKSRPGTGTIRAGSQKRFLAQGHRGTDHMPPAVTDKSPPTSTAGTTHAGAAGATPGDFAVEVGDSRNRNFIWPLDQRALRGAWKKNHLPGVVMDERFAHMPDLPGQQIHVSCQRRVVRVVDPLNDPRYARVLE